MSKAKESSKQLESNALITTLCRQDTRSFRMQRLKSGLNIDKCKSMSGIRTRDTKPTRLSGARSNHWTTGKTQIGCWYTTCV